VVRRLERSVDTKLNVGRLITNAGGSIKSLMAETAMVNGKFPSNQANYNNFLNGFLTPIWESLDRVEGGGYGYGGFPGGRSATARTGPPRSARTNPNLHYIHVIDKPTSGNSITFQDNAYKVTKVTDLRTGAARSFTQANGSVTISGNQLGPVRHGLQGGDQRPAGVYPSSSLTASASASASGHAASAVLDGKFDTYWDSKLDAAGEHHARPGQRAAGPLPGDQPARLVADPRAGRLRRRAGLGPDQGLPGPDQHHGSSWTTVEVRYPAEQARRPDDRPGRRQRPYVRLNVTSTWSGSKAGNYYKKLRIDELFLGSAWA
jgi:alpha-L-fucosidase